MLSSSVSIPSDIHCLSSTNPCNTLPLSKTVHQCCFTDCRNGRVAGSLRPNHHLLSHRAARQLSVKCAAISDTLPCISDHSSLYSILGLEQNVSQAEIKTAYRRMARRYHPDVCAASDKQESTHKFLQVQEAYEILSDPEQRADYDYSLLHPFCVQALGRGFDFNVEKTSRGRRSDESRQEVSFAWKLQWEAQLTRLRSQTGRSKSGCATDSWGATMRHKNFYTPESDAK